MKVIIAGSRFITDYNLVVLAVKESGFDITEVVCGAANGVDSLGERYAKENGIKLSYFYADWKGLGKLAGHKRNEQMGNYGEALIAVWDGKSPGTKHMINFAKKKKLLTYVKNINEINLNKFFEIE
jgi:hypothetical protein